MFAFNYLPFKFSTRSSLLAPVARQVIFRCLRNTLKLLLEIRLLANTKFLQKFILRNFESTAVFCLQTINDINKIDI